MPVIQFVNNTNMKYLLIIISVTLQYSLCLAQSVEVVTSKTISSNTGTSFIFSTEVRLLPGFTHSAATQGAFFCQHENYVNQPLSLDKNFVRVETALDATTSDGTFSSWGTDKKTIQYEYVDESGRPLQTIAVKASPSQKDIVSFSDYNAVDGWQTKIYMPYSTNVTNNGSFATNTIGNQSTFYTTTPEIATDSRPFSEHTVVEKSPLARVKEAYGAGSAWYSSNHKVTSGFKVNSVSEPVKLWRINSAGLPVSDSNYPVGTIIISSSTDEEGNNAHSFKDYRGNVVQTLVQGSPDLITYHIYDVFGRLRFTIPPALADNLAPDQAALDKWAFQYIYDERGRLIKEKKPGIDWLWYVYDQWDRLVLSQDGNQRAASPKKWLFSKYDEFNRVVITGLYSNNNNYEQMVAAITGGRFESRNTSAIGYTLSNSFPTGLAEADLLSITYFDDYTFLGNSGWDAEGFSYAFQTDVQFPEPKTNGVKGLATGSKIKIMGQNKWLNAVTYYDKQYRTIQSVQEHHLAGTDRVFVQLNYPGWVLKSKRNHTSSAGTVSVLEEFSYDDGGRPLKHYHTLDNGPRVLLASNRYNELGQLVEVNTHSVDETNFLQSTDYRYNIRGWLTHINNSTLTNDGVTNNDANDLFGMQIVYHDETQIVNGTATTPRYNGLISAIKWQTNNLKDAPKERIYGHYYTPGINQLNQSLFAARNGSTWTGEPGYYDLTGVTYDKNGNILTLNRFAEANNARINLDQLTYGYNNNGNKLTTVEDAGSPGFGFKNGTSGLTTEYEYDPAGNLTVDLNKEMVAVQYNIHNLPEYIEFYNGWKLEYTYDATGYAIKKVLKKDNTIVRQVDYVAGIQYFDNALKLVFTANGRAVKAGTTYDYEYFLTDHLGNTRVVYGYLRNTDVYRATMETALATTEEAAFKNVAARRFTSTTFNYTRKSLDIPVPDKSAETNGFLGKAIGPAKMLAVTAGDKVTLEAVARYTTSTAGNNAIITNLVTAVTGAYGIVNSGETQTAWQALNNNLPGTASTIPVTTNVPKAYLYYIIFNSSYVYQQFGYYAVPPAAQLGHVPLKLEVNVPVNGFLYTYVANESNVGSATSVYFDDFTIIHEKNSYSLRVVESTDYDPFGAILEGTRYVDISRPLNGYLYQGEYAEFEELTGWSRFIGRGNYDATLGRWSTVDPLNQFASPFVGMANNPVNGVDPDGRFAVLPFLAGMAKHMVAGAIKGGLENALQQITRDEPRLDGDELLKAMARGAIHSGIGYGLGALGLDIATTLANRGTPGFTETYSDGFINLAFQMASTSANSILSNLAVGDPAFSRMDIGVTDFNIPIRDGKFSWRLTDHLGNMATLFSYSRGFIDVLNKKATVRINPTSLSPEFKAMPRKFVYDCEEGWSIDKSNRGTTWRMTDRADASVNQNGAIFLKNGATPGTIFHESLHSIFSRISGSSNPFIASQIFGFHTGVNHDKNYWEGILVPFTNRYPR